VWSPPDPGKGVEGDQLMLQVGGRGEDWKVDGCLESTQNNGGAESTQNNGGAESTQNNGGAPSFCGRFGDLLLFFIAAKS
jgi:hypothetical protein